MILPLNVAGFSLSPTAPSDTLTHHSPPHDIDRWPLLNSCCLFCAQHIFQHGTQHECLDGSPANSSCHRHGQATTGISGCGIIQTSMVSSVLGFAHISQSFLPEVISHTRSMIYSDKTLFQKSNRTLRFACGARHFSKLRMSYSSIAGQLVNCIVA